MPWLTLGATGAHLARAALEAVAYQTRDLLDAMIADRCAQPAALRVDGGMAANDWLCQFLADIAGVRVERPNSVETTALGAAFLAGLCAGQWSGTADIAQCWSAEHAFVPGMAEARRRTLLDGWHDAVARTIGR